MNIFEPWLHAIPLEDQMFRSLFHFLYNILKKIIWRGKMKVLPGAEYSILYQNLPLEFVYRKDLITRQWHLYQNKNIFKFKLVKTNTPADFQSFSFQLSLECFIFAIPLIKKKTTKRSAQKCISPYLVLLIKIFLLGKYKIHKPTCDCELKFTSFLKCHLLSIY